MKQTAVEWLVNEMPVIDWQVPYWKIKLDKAKEMEKEHIGRAYQEGLIDGMNHTPKDYYNETYGGESKT